jgi:hypothetical protein
MKNGYRIALIVLAVLTTLSLALNVAVIFGLLQARQIVLTAMADARAVVIGIGDETFSYTFEVRQEIPIATTVPFNEEITVPVKTTIPIDTTVVIPIDLGITTYNLEVPIRTLIPVDLAFAVPISQTVDIRTTVPLELDVPIEIPLADTPLVGYLEEIDATLARLGEKLAHPLGGGEE